ncbi:MAG: hypothetical protein ABL999_08620 [Pyrinomonadaceae bacterium]
MIKVLEKSNKATRKDFDSLLIEIPTDFARSHGLPEQAIAALTVKDGKLSSEIIEYSDTDKSEVEGFLEQFPDLNEEMISSGE